MNGPDGISVGAHLDLYRDGASRPFLIVREVQEKFKVII